MSTEKSRPIPFGVGPGRYRFYRRLQTTKVAEEFGTPPNEPPSRPAHLQGKQVTVSESHPDWRRLSAAAGDVGGNFSSTRQYAHSPIGNVHVDTGWAPSGITYDVRYVYDGPMSFSGWNVPGTTPFPPFASSSVSTLNSYGATAIARCAPTKPTANLATALLEVYHDGLPKMIGRDTWRLRTEKAKDLHRQGAVQGSSEFLNYQFGILPLVGDVQDFVKAVINLDKLLQQFIRDNGQVVRRRYSFKPEVSTVETVVNANATPWLGSNSANFVNTVALPRPQLLRRRETTVNRWFSGAFVYHLPQTFFAELYTPFAKEFQIYRKVFGLELTPEVLWEVAPWSWAVDWFSNVGDVVHNTSAWANNGLVMKYGYIMEHSIVRDTYTYVGLTRLKGDSTSRPPDLILTSESKLRRAANPFGFGLTLDGLTNLQKSILVAVGLSRLR